MLSRSSIFTDTLTLSRPTADQDSEQRNQLDDRLMLSFHPHNNKSQLLVIVAILYQLKGQSRTRKVKLSSNIQLKFPFSCFLFEADVVHLSCHILFP